MILADDHAAPAGQIDTHILWLSDHRGLLSSVPFRCRNHECAPATRTASGRGTLAHDSALRIRRRPIRPPGATREQPTRSFIPSPLSAPSVGKTVGVVGESPLEQLSQALTLVEVLRAENETLRDRVAHLEAELAKNSDNSSKPPATDPVEVRKSRAERRADARKAVRRQGKQPGAPGANLSRRKPDVVELHPPLCCPDCGADLADAPVTAETVRQVIDLSPVRPTVSDHVVQRRRCSCGTETTGVFPPQARAPVRWGPEVWALAMYLMDRQHLPLARTAELLAELLELANDRVKPVAQIARDLGISESCLRRWMEVAAVEEGRKEGEQRRAGRARRAAAQVAGRGDGERDPAPGGRLFRPGERPAKMTYTFISRACSDLPVAVCCRVMKVSTSGFYAWRAQPCSGS